VRRYLDTKVEKEKVDRLIRAAITDFVPEIDTGYIQIRDRQYVEEAASSEPLQLIDYVMADNDYNGTFRCCSIIENTGEDMIFITPGNVKIIAVDVFGREYDGGII
jgi:hypothetical protein